MRERGAAAIARAVALSRPEIVCGRDSAPRAPLAEALAGMVSAGELPRCEFIAADSDAAALSAAVGAAAAGARACVIACRNSLLAMAPAVFGAARRQLPVVMSVVGCADEMPGSLALRDAGWVQLHAGSAQEAADLHIQAFRLAAALDCPVMVCTDDDTVDGTAAAVRLPAQPQVDAYLDAVVPPAPSRTGGVPAAARVAGFAEEFWQQFGRDAGALLHAHRTEDAEVVVLVLAPAFAMASAAVDGLRADGLAAGAIGVGAMRPFPVAQLRDALGGARTVVIIEPCFAAGSGIVTEAAGPSLAGTPLRACTVFAGTGGRDLTATRLAHLLQEAAHGALASVTLIDATLREREAAPGHRPFQGGPHLHAVPSGPLAGSPGR